MPTTAPLVVVTGASSGIGQALALCFYQRGYRLALVARRSTEIGVWAASQSLEADRFKIYSADVTDPEAMAQMGRSCLQSQGIPDVVIANAGISVGIDSANRADIEVMSRVFATNNVGMMATFHPFIQPMIDRAAASGRKLAGSAVGGTLVGIGSVAGIRGLPGHGAYCASKSAAIAYCESLRGELRPLGIKVVTLCPGYIDTPLTKKNPYSMPFLMQPKAFAVAALQAIESGVSYRVIPWQMGLVGKLLRILPNWLFDRAFAGRPRKHRQGGS